MPSLVWGRDPQEAFEEPYEYGIQEQFLREARGLLHHLYEAFNAEIHTHTIQERSSDKAVWLLALDSLDSLRSAVDCIERKEHRLTGRLFRDVTETMDLAAYFFAATDNAVADLEKWYNDEIVPHRCYRD